MKKILKRNMLIALTAMMCVCMALFVGTLNFNVKTAKADNGVINGISIVGDNGSSTAINQMLIQNLSTSYSLTDTESIIFNIYKGDKLYDTEATFCLSVIDTTGNWYEYMGLSGSQGTLKKANSLDALNTVSSESVGNWKSFTSDLSGNGYYELPIENFYARSNANQYYEDGTWGDLGNAVNLGAALDSSRNIYAVVLRFQNSTMKYANLTVCDTYVRKTDGSIEKINDVSTQVPSNNLKFSTVKGEFWVGFVQMWATYDTDNVATALGWVNDTVELSATVEKTGSLLDEPTYGRLDGALFEIIDGENSDFKFIFIEGDKTGITDSEYVSVRIADHGNAKNRFEFFFYNTSSISNYTRWGIKEGSPVYLINKNGTYNSTIYPLNPWSWFELPASFDGYMVAPFDSFESTLDKDAVKSVCFVSQGTQLVSSQQQGTTTTETSPGLHLEIGEINFVDGVLTADSSTCNYNELTKILFAKTLSDNRYSVANFVNSYTCTPIVSTSMDYSYSIINGVVFVADENAKITVDVSNANGAYIALYIYNEMVTEQQIKFSYDDGTTAVTNAKLIDIFDEVSEPASTDGTFTLPSNFEGYVILPYSNQSELNIEIADGDRLVVKDVFSLSTQSCSNVTEVVSKCASIIRTVAATDSAINSTFTLSNATVKRAVNSTVLADDAPEIVEESMAKVNVLTEDASVLKIADKMPAYKCYVPDADAFVLLYSKMPSVLKASGLKYVLVDEGASITVKAETAGVIYVVASKDFADASFTKVMAYDSFISGISDRIFIYKRTLAVDEEVTVQDHYMLVINSEREDLLSAQATYMYFFDDIPEIYKPENTDFIGAPSGYVVLPNGRTYIMVTSGGRTEPTIENVGYVLVSETPESKPVSYMVVDPPYVSAVRACDIMVFYDDALNRLFIQYTQDNGSFDYLTSWIMYSDNPDAENLEDVVWSEPKVLYEGYIHVKTEKLSNGKFIMNASPTISTTVLDVVLFDPNTVTLQKISQVNVGHIAYFPETSWVELNNGNLWMLTRDDKGSTPDYITEYFSVDGGYTWSTGKTNYDLYINSSNFYIMRMPSGNLVWISNAGPNRSNLTAKISTDDGATWQGGLLLDSREWASYPKASITPDGKIIVVYDKGRTIEKELRYAVFTEQDILDGAFNSEGSVQYGTYFKGNSYYIELTKLFDEIKTEYRVGTTVMQILNSLDTSVMVGDNNHQLHVLEGKWTAAGKIDANGYLTIAFAPTGGLPSNMSDIFGVLKVKVHVAQKAASSIGVTTLPTKLTYTVGEQIDLTGMVVTLYYNDNTGVELQSGDYTVSGFTSAQAGTCTVTVTYGTFTDTFTVTIENPPQNNNSGGGCGGQITGLGGIGLMLIAGAFVALNLRKRKN